MMSYMTSQSGARIDASEVVAFCKDAEPDRYLFVDSYTQ